MFSGIRPAFFTPGVKTRCLAVLLALAVGGCAGVTQVSWPPRVLWPEPAKPGEPPPPLPESGPEAPRGAF